MNAYNSSEDRERVLKRMQEADVAANVTTWTTLMNAYNTFDERMSVYMGMINPPHPWASCSPNSVTLSSLLDATDIREHRVKVRAFDFLQCRPDHHLCDHYVLGKLLRICADLENIACMERFWKIGSDGLSSTLVGWPGKFLFKQFNDLCSKMGRHKAGWRHLSRLVNAGHTDESRGPSDGAVREGGGGWGRGAPAGGGAAAAAPRVAPPSSSKWGRGDAEQGGSRWGSAAPPRRS